MSGKKIIDSWEKKSQNCPLKATSKEKKTYDPPCSAAQISGPVKLTTSGTGFPVRLVAAFRKQQLLFGEISWEAAGFNGAKTAALAQAEEKPPPKTVRANLY